MSTLNKLESDLKEGLISRREFLHAASILGLAAIAPSILNSAHATPKKGGKFTGGMARFYYRFVGSRDLRKRFYDWIGICSI